MPFFILEKNIALRSWKLVPCAYYTKGKELPNSISQEAFDVLLKCDARHDIPESELTTQLQSVGLIRRCGEGECELSDFQKYRNCRNYITPYINLQITERCNFNCLHCFNAADNAVPKEQMSFEQIDDILDQAVDCGVASVLITGGEPLVHPDFMKIADLIAQKGLSMFELNTNGYFLTEEILDHLISIGLKPEMKISFDGLGFHDKMRGAAGAEKKTIDALKLCISKGFKVMAQMNMNRLNLGCIPESLELLDSIGIQRTRLIRTSEAPRWEENAEGQTLSWAEYYQAALDVSAKYAEKEHRMDLLFWEFLIVNPKSKSFFSLAVRYNPASFNEDRPLCKGARGMPAIGGNGEVYPCMQFEGYCKKYGISFANVFKRKLQSILSEGPFCELVRSTVKDRVECPDCEFVQYCGGGCPAISTLTSKAPNCPDRAKCVYFKQGWHEKIKQTLPDYKDVNPYPYNH